MIQFNLLPDVKLQFIKAQRRKRLVMTISFVATVVSLVIFISLLLFVRVGQKQQLANLDKNIGDSTKKLQDVKDLDKILTIQNQLKSLPDLHSQKVISSRLFDYLTQITPAKATISDVSIDFAANTLNIKGNADTLQTVNQYADTLKFTQFPKKKAELQKNDKGVIDCQAASLKDFCMVNAFSAVVLKSFTVGGGKVTKENEGKAIGYELGFTFDPAIFANVKGDTDNPIPRLTIPKIITTRSETEKPANLFVPQPQPVVPGEAGQ
jgi:Tfp pilus assembly protein PilN